jgi:hypothetical protein
MISLPHSTISTRRSPTPVATSLHRRPRPRHRHQRAGGAHSDSGTRNAKRLRRTGRPSRTTRPVVTRLRSCQEPKGSPGSCPSKHEAQEDEKGQRESHPCERPEQAPVAEHNGPRPVWLPGPLPETAAEGYGGDQDDKQADRSGDDRCTSVRHRASAGRYSERSDPVWRSRVEHALIRCGPEDGPGGPARRGQRRSRP